MDEYQGLLTYSDGLSLQQKAYDEVYAKNKSVLVLGLEHKPVICLGRRSSIEKDLLMPQQFYLENAYEIVKADRGGLASIHNPGQVVIYPVVDLGFYKMGLKDFVCLLLKVSQEALKSFGLETSISKEQDGLFCGAAKLAFVGLRLKENISFHGLAINLNNDLSMYNHIYACGVKSAKITSAKELGFNIECEDFYHKWLEVFKNRLQAIKSH